MPPCRADGARSTAVGRRRERDAPAITIKLLANVGAALSIRLRRANRTIHQLEK
jgi:hypothetical protein